VELVGSLLIDDFDGDGQAAWDQMDGQFQQIGQAPEPAPGAFLIAYPIQFHDRPAIVRGWGVVHVIAWPELELVIEHRAGSERIRPLGEAVLLSDSRDASTPSYLLDLETGNQRSLTSEGRNVDTVAAPDGSLFATFVADGGRRTLAWLGPSSEAGYPWPRMADLRGAVELDDDPVPELVGVRHGKLAIVDWRDGSWRWSAPFCKSDHGMVGAGELDGRPGVDLLFWAPATLASGCSASGCERAIELTELGETTGPVYLDANGVLTWAVRTEIHTLRCDPSIRLARGPHERGVESLASGDESPRL
jgi:hypothetical protein